MKKRNFFAMICLFFVTPFALAGQSGYLLNGKVVITHKDGLALASDPDPATKTEPRGQRSPAAAIKVQGVLFFDEDDLARCYWLANQASLQCVKK